jgi:hypothetical protein
LLIRNVLRFEAVSIWFYQQQYLEGASARPAPGSKNQLKKESDQSQRVMGHLKHLMASSKTAERRAPTQVPVVGLVTGLFHDVLKNDTLSPMTRVWVARLQLPVMRQALLDPVGFEDPAHPARCLIANIGACSLVLINSALPSGELEKKIKQLVDLIECFAVADRQVFEKANQQFSQFLAHFKNKTTMPILTDGTACLHDQKKALTAHYRVAMRDALINKPVQTEIREFLCHVWTESMATHAIDKGLEHAQAVELKHIAMELVEINTALLRRKDRHSAIGKVPHLVKKLRFGMSLIGLSIEVQDEHIKKIGTNLTDAFLSENHPIASDAPNTERRSPKRHQKSGHGSTSQKIEIEGLLVIHEDADLAWHLWECALVEQGQKPAASHSVSPKAEQETQPTPLDYWQTYRGDNL